jgi:coatomer subunit gamma
LVAYIKDPKAAEQPFDISSIPKVSRAQAAQEAARKRACTTFWCHLTTETSGPSTLETIGLPAAKEASITPPPPTIAETQTAYAQQLADVPEFASYGPLIHSTTKPTHLTESETEYQVTCVKHLFKKHIVFQVRVF